MSADRSRPRPRFSRSAPLDATRGEDGRIKLIVGQRLVGVGLHPFADGAVQRRPDKANEHEVVEVSRLQARVLPVVGEASSLRAVSEMPIVSRRPGPHTEPGGDFFARRHPERTRKRLVGRLERLGCTITLQEGPRQPEREFSTATARAERRTAAPCA